MRAQLAKVSTRLQFADQMAKFSRYLLEANAFDDAAPLLRESLTVRIAQFPEELSTQPKAV